MVRVYELHDYKITPDFSSMLIFLYVFISCKLTIIINLGLISDLIKKQEGEHSRSACQRSRRHALDLYLESGVRQGTSLDQWMVESKGIILLLNFVCNFSP